MQVRAHNVVALFMAAWTEGTAAMQVRAHNVVALFMAAWSGIFIVNN
jgi:hypothetical protein